MVQISELRAASNGTTTHFQQLIPLPAKKNILKLTKRNTSSKDVNKCCQLYGCFRKWWYPQIIHSFKDFHYKPSILGYPYLWKHPYTTEATKTNRCHPKNRSRIPIPYRIYETNGIFTYTLVDIYGKLVRNSTKYHEFFAGLKAIIFWGLS